jgi:hypothetical protein
MLNSKIKEGKRKNHVSVAAQKEIKKKAILSRPEIGKIRE